jgi:hypothetical protein
MPLARCRCCDETNYRRLPHRGLAPKGAMPWASHKTRRRQEGEFSIIFLPLSRCPMSEMSAEVNPIGRTTYKVHSPHALVSPLGALDPRAAARMASSGLLTDDCFSRISELWNHGGGWSGWSQSYACMTALRAPKFDLNWQIIDWTALTDKANGNALKDANAYVVESFLKKASLQDIPKAPRHGYD